MAKARIQFMDVVVSGVTRTYPAYWCLVCNHPHRVNVDFAGPPRWTWNGDVNKPTFKPSVLWYSDKPQGRYWLLKRNGVYAGYMDNGAQRNFEFNSLTDALTYAESHASDNGGSGWGAVQRNRSGVQRHVYCHVHVTDGNLKVLPDSPGPLGGKTVPLPEWDVDEYMNPNRKPE